ncbi:MAG: hypothetical protein A3B74_02720 [Candidatus Kerfeldbacteria bacterium RIFCSPHIGHO2_02_FULL_42_14]|uniref:Calcineurin-like phosphoesterase domain-containing protein n=1 Tax=Candidatus Kerfeldbacteria bacterium RIFCSPHIGHO2_02_FULL_42_14 TaxID=1798540 RepID=A0A1G2ARX0_9BACT|nr:MAG: hypothetical protein A3B74_02720 [Candidatus Kerfeldbacteria bacterium RIFCSPHIGHO2_02_FULL_42_14]
MKKKFFLFILIIVGVLFAIFGWYAFKDTQTRASLQRALEIAAPKEPKVLLTFIVFGDNEGVNPIVERILEDAKKLGVDFVVNVADLTSHGKKAEYQAVAETFQQAGVSYYAAIGNNDLGKPISRALFQQYIRPQTYYSFDAGPAHFVILDNADRKVGFDTAQLTWLKADLNSQKQPYVFLFYHRPVNVPFTEYTGDDETPASRSSNADFVSIIKTYLITRIYNGHVHLYFPYHLEDIPVRITGGGGAPPQSFLGGESSAFFHYIKVIITEDGISEAVIPLE